ncbi:MAG TPA: response regulator [Bdellovibrionales bacterium]|nr:MAG: hypothetical protein A2Z97_06475 [Bdellovibrionales bacterium GWB1_52_6]OFZ05530.1 MAG: hypothetical protein A2X97_11705 [Bdellovibrionales bacterium GWA1_52_35]OFZ43981.1 MAG: hypothetical protein A2070_11825 [Bdellovibrionales bacterium GWC1_52_8]HAR44510.1 response regulator [Bdellovibrionales bacterium]HCM39101.1 response regulator [Bdellovibrionales bacterium]
MSDTHPKTILVIEDDEDILFAVSTFLELEGYLVRTATDGASALERLKREGMPDLILLDMIMPVMNGWQFAAEFHENYRTPVPIVVMTAAANAEQRAKDIGAAGWISKPFKIEELLTRIQAYEPRR